MINNLYTASSFLRPLHDLMRHNDTFLLFMAFVYFLFTTVCIIASVEVYWFFAITWLATTIIFFMDFKLYCDFDWSKSLFSEKY